MQIGREQVIDLEAGHMERFEEYKFLGVSFTKT